MYLQKFFFFLLEKETPSSSIQVFFPSFFLPSIAKVRYRSHTKRHESKTERRGIYLKVLSSSSEKTFFFQKLKSTLCTIFSLCFSLHSWSIGSVQLNWGKKFHFTWTTTLSQPLTSNLSRPPCSQRHLASMIGTTHIHPLMHGWYEKEGEILTEILFC